jgi:ABC-type molybdate transport system permease subunit
MLRTLLSFGLIAPPVIAGIVTAVFVSRQGPIAGTLVGTVIALVEAGALIAFAAWRLAGHVDRLGLA